MTNDVTRSGEISPVSDSMNDLDDSTCPDQFSAVRDRCHQPINEYYNLNDIIAVQFALNFEPDLMIISGVNQWGIFAGV